MFVSYKIINMTQIKKEYRTIKQLSEKYGLSKSYFHKLTFNREIPFVKSGNGVRSRVLICENEFIAHLESNQVESKESIESKSAIPV